MSWYSLVMEDPEALRVRHPSVGLQRRLSRRIPHETIVPPGLHTRLVRPNARPPDLPLAGTRFPNRGCVTERLRSATSAWPATTRTARWEELRVSLFAQSLGTAEPASEQRLRKALDRLVPAPQPSRSG